MQITKEYIQKYNPNLDIEAERWVALFGYEGVLEVSNYGNIRRLPYHCTYTRLGTKVHKFFDTFIYTIYFSVDGYPKCRVIGNRELSCHRAVALSFLSRPDNYDQMEVDHIDYTPQNCYYKNLQWVTPKQNKDRSYIHIVQKNGRLVRDIKSGKIYATIEDFSDYIGVSTKVVAHGLYQIDGYVPKYDICLEYYDGDFSDVGSIKKYPTDNDKIFALRANCVRRYGYKGVRCLNNGQVYLNALTASKSLGLPRYCVAEVLKDRNGIYKKLNLKFEYIDWRFATDSDISKVIEHFISMNAKSAGRYTKR